jgi:hypothetical protein
MENRVSKRKSHVHGEQQKNKQQKNKWQQKQQRAEVAEAAREAGNRCSRNRGRSIVAAEAEAEVY